MAAPKSVKVRYVGGASDGVIVDGQHVEQGGEVAVPEPLAVKLVAGIDFELAAGGSKKDSAEAEEADK